MKSQRLIRKALKKGKSGIAFSGGKDSTVILHLVRQIDPSIPCVFLDHGRHFPETYEFVDTIENVQTISKTDWEPDPTACCGFAKIDLIQKAIRDLELDVLFVGIRRDEHPARNIRGYKETFPDHTRVYPILDWTVEDVWDFLNSKAASVNSLYSKGYLSIGCTNCTTKGGKTEREGRGTKEVIMDRLRQLGYF